ncbi:MAG TPA: hypothetical protein VGC95_01965 [Chitinophagaceae bacterium]
MDLIGCLTYAVPVFGEAADIVWAPVSAVIFFVSFRTWGWKAALGALGDFVEEILPGTDFIPSFTIMWLIQNIKSVPAPRPSSEAARSSTQSPRPSSQSPRPSSRKTIRR